jgi:hypothetical protein
VIGLPLVVKEFDVLFGCCYLSIVFYVVYDVYDLMWDKLVAISNQDSENTYGIQKTMTHVQPRHCTYTVADTNMIISMTP